MLTGPPPKFHGTRDILSVVFIECFAHGTQTCVAGADGIEDVEEKLGIDARLDHRSIRMCGRSLRLRCADCDQPYWQPHGGTIAPSYRT